MRTNRYNKYLARGREQCSVTMPISYRTQNYLHIETISPAPFVQWLSIYFCVKENELLAPQSRCSTTIVVLVWSQCLVLEEQGFPVGQFPKMQFISTLYNFACTHASDIRLSLPYRSSKRIAAGIIHVWLMRTHTCHHADFPKKNKNYSHIEYFSPDNFNQWILIYFLENELNTITLQCNWAEIIFVPFC